jgi:tRNA dimethylallyltransferase
MNGSAEKTFSMKGPWTLIVLLGPTASGKTALAARLAHEMGSEIISADSRQVYRGLDLGSGKDLSEYVIGGRRIPCHLIDIVDPGLEEFSVFEFRKRFDLCYRALRERNLVPILAGGTGLYLESVLLDYGMAEVPENPGLRRELEGLSMEALAGRLASLRPALHNTTDLVERERLVRAIEIAAFQGGLEEKAESAGERLLPLVIGVRVERAVLRRRITERLKRRFDEGMVEEVASLHEKGVSWETLHRLGLEYRYISLHLRGELSFDEMFRTLNTRIHQFAKRQETWFRRMEARGVAIHWVGGGDYEAVRRLVFGSGEDGPERVS